MSLLRYAGAGLKTDRGPLQFGRVGMDGLPFRANPDSLYTNKEIEQKAFISADVGVRVFNLSVPEDLKEYGEILEKAANGLYQLLLDREDFVPETGTYMVLVKWTMSALEMPAY